MMSNRGLEALDADAFSHALDEPPCWNRKNCSCRNNPSSHIKNCSTCQKWWPPLPSLIGAGLKFQSRKERRGFKLIQIKSQVEGSYFTLEAGPFKKLWLRSVHYLKPLSVLLAGQPKRNAKKRRTDPASLIPFIYIQGPFRLKQLCLIRGCHVWFSYRFKCGITIFKNGSSDPALTAFNSEVDIGCFCVLSPIDEADVMVASPALKNIFKHFTVCFDLDAGLFFFCMCPFFYHFFRQ